MVNRDNDDLKLAKAKAREAIALATEGRWEEAVVLNRELLDLQPDNLDACNRLGKALLELGDTDGARSTFQRSLSIDPASSIAKKNIERLSTGTAGPSGAQLSSKMFIGDSGKSAQVGLFASPPISERPFVSPGAPVVLDGLSGNLGVFTKAGQYLGLVPPKLARRLLCMIDEGNRYDGVVASSSNDAVIVILRETYQHPSQRAKVSFPSASVVEPTKAAVTQIDPDDLPSRPAADDSGEPPIDLSFLEVANLEAAGVSANGLFDDIPDDDLFPETFDEDPSS